MESSNVQQFSHVQHTPEVSMNGNCLDIEDDNQLSLCCLCGKTFPTISSLHFHIDSEHDDGENEKHPLAIDEEQSGSDSAYYLPSPNSTAILPTPSPDDCETTEKFSCPICKRRFSGHTSLKVHMETIHHGNRSAICELCQKRFSTLSYLRLHIATVHEGLKAYTCTICSKSYTQKHSLKKHISTAHPNAHYAKSSNQNNVTLSKHPQSIAPAPPSSSSFPQSSSSHNTTVSRHSLSISPASPSSSSFSHQRLIAPAKPAAEPGTVPCDSPTDLPPILVAEIFTPVIDNTSASSSPPPTTPILPPSSVSFGSIETVTTTVELDGNDHDAIDDAH